jgi:hypothetical protein
MERNQKRPEALSSLGLARKVTAMQSAFPRDVQCNSSDQLQDDPNGFESVGSILRRALEEQMTETFDPAISLKLDALICDEQQRQEEEGQ